MRFVLEDAALAVGCVQGSAVGAAWILRRREAWLQRYLPYLVSLAVGVLLATALIDLLPEAVTQLGNRRLTWMLLGGTMLVLFAVETHLLSVDGIGYGARGRWAGRRDAYPSPCWRLVRPRGRAQREADESGFWRRCCTAWWTGLPWRSHLPRARASAG